MPPIIPNQLFQRLEKFATQEGISTEQLLERWLDQAESQEFPDNAQRQIEDLRMSRARFQGILDSQIDLVCRYKPDTTLTFVNDAYCQFFGRPREELIGKSFLDLVEEVPESQDQVHIRLRRVLASPEPDVMTILSIVPKKGERWIQWVDAGITDSTGQVVEVQAVGRDVTDLIVSRRNLEQQTELLEKIVDHIPLMIALINPEGQFEWVNQCWVDVLGWTVEEMQEQPDMMALFYPDPDYRQSAIDYMSRGQPGWKDWETIAKDGTVTECMWANVRLSDGRMIGIGQDISERRKLEQQQIYAKKLEIELQKEREMMELRGRILSIISHEFKTPLAVITSSVEILERYTDRLSPENIEKKFEGIRHQVNHLVNLLEDITNLDKTRQDKVTPVMSELDVEQFCQRVVDSMNLLYRQTHTIQLDVRSSGSIRADTHLLEHVFINLLSNAVKYSHPDTVIHFTVEQNTTTWLFHVEDSGIGIPPADLTHLFEPFYRATNVNTISGTGLGLSLVREYVELHSGTVHVESIEGQGTTFTVELPR